MDASEQPFQANEYEPQNFPVIELELQLDGNDAEAPLFIDNEYDRQSFPLDAEQNFNGVDHENEHFVNDESKVGDEVLQEQTFEENESEHQLAENEAVENDSKEDFADIEIEHNETHEFAEDQQLEEKQDQTDTATADTEDKKWPGWPGENVFRMLVPAQKVGNIIGRKGEYIKKIVEETRARIKILDGPPGTAERAVLCALFKAANIVTSNLLLQMWKIRDRLPGHTTV